MSGRYVGLSGRVTERDRHLAVIRCLPTPVDPGMPEERPTAFLKLHPAEAMKVTEVGTAVNSPKNDGLEYQEAA